MDFVKSMCEKPWAEVQVNSFSSECRGCVKMKGLEMEVDRLRQLVLALVGREEVGCASDSDGGTVDDKVGEAMRELLGRAHIRIRRRQDVRDCR